TYELWIRPKFWMLNFVSDCRIFQNKSALSIIKSVLTENGVTDFQDHTSSSGHRTREYCVQYNETCFDFVSRLMEEEGICYYFSHNNGSHTMFLTDYQNGHKPCPSLHKARFMPGKGSEHFENVVIRAQSIEQVTIAKQSCADYNFTTASTPLYATISGRGAGGMFYHYPGFFDHEDKPNQGGVEMDASTRLDMELLPKEALEGVSTIPFLTHGHYFSLSGYDRKGADGDYVVHSVTHRITANTHVVDNQTVYENSFVAFPKKVRYRPPHIHKKHRIYSTQTARVTGKPGEEIWTDQYGRIKVKFHWDESGPHKGPSDDKSSCWIRVSEGWAGSKWGILFTP
ncbi:MAG: type VI secretion system Vgr family protein, partial [Bacteroidota bacterium]